MLSYDISCFSFKSSLLDFGSDTYSNSVDNKASRLDKKRNKLV